MSRIEQSDAQSIYTARIALEFFKGHTKFFWLFWAFSDAESLYPFHLKCC